MIVMRTMKDKEGSLGPVRAGREGDIEANPQRKGGLDIRSCGSVWKLKTLTE